MRQLSLSHLPELFSNTLFLLIALLSHQDSFPVFPPALSTHDAFNYTGAKVFRVCCPPYHSELEILVFFFLLVNLSFQSKCGRMCVSPLSVRPPTVTSLMVCRHCLGGSLSWWNSENPPLCSECSVAGIIPKYPALCFISTHEIPLRHFLLRLEFGVILNCL